MGGTFEQLLAEAVAAPVDGWDFSWLDGRATEERPSWGFQRMMSRRLAGVSAALDLQTGGGEVLSGVEKFPPTMAATESWPPNAARAAHRLNPRGVAVLLIRNEPPLPFADEAFDLVTSRHPIAVWWSEIARVLRPGGTYLAQHPGPATAIELIEAVLGPMPDLGAHMEPSVQEAQAQAAGLQVLDIRIEKLAAEYFDIGAVVYFLRKLIWDVPDFTAEPFLTRLRAIHEQIEEEGRFVTYPTRVLVEARKPLRG
ncbi:methyltransferase domain-containing protein [Mycobacterium barrassiae]|uniref:class I SAM-dependent methyltransferase n=1 Tax=Mycobacterium barrassiae TaxID=319709 RepID=UPI002265998D|nr:class I SAM-dependent methyltransferase [Mycobacterium barrassiae]MCV7302304.1 methyltransferase domain-containing protein [Mycobacterium barrassiae]